MTGLIIYYFLLIVLSNLALYYNIIILLVPILYILVLLFRYNYKYFLIAVVFIVVTNLYFTNSLNKQPPQDKEFRVIKASDYNYQLQNKEGKVILKTNKKLNKNDIVRVKGYYSPLEGIENFNLFSNDNYLKSLNIFYEIKDKNPIIIKEAETKSRNKIDEYFAYLYLMDKSGIDKEIRDTLQELSIVHLVVISGLHFNIFYKILNVVFVWIKKDYIRYIIIFSLLILYLVNINFAYPATRAVLSLIVSKTRINKLSRINQLSLVGIIMYIFNPLTLLSTSFLLTFYVSYIIILIPTYLRKNKLIFSFSIFLGIIPFITNMNYQLSVFSFIYTILFTPIIALLYIVVVLANFLSVFSNLSESYINMFEDLLLYVNNNNLIIKTGYLPIFLCLFYFVLFCFAISKADKNKLYLVLPVFFIVVYSYLPSLNGFVTYLNVGQGDCIIIKPFFSKKAMIIDVSQTFKQKNVERIIIPYLKSMKINTVEKLVITHADADHAGGREDLERLFNVEQVISEKTNKITFDKFTFIDILANSKFDDVNRNSITLYSRINSLNYLFTGDIDKEAELEMKRYVSKLPVDILKVAHHGSKTSTSDDFLALTNPSIAIAQLKKNNQYNHPHPIVVERLLSRNIKFYNNGDNGTITIFFNPFFYNIQTYK